MRERLTGSQLIADLFKGYGVTHVFFVPTILSHSLYQMEQRSCVTRVVTQRVVSPSRCRGFSTVAPSGGAVALGGGGDG